MMRISFVRTTLRGRRVTARLAAVPLALLPLLALASVSRLMAQTVDCDTVVDDGERLKCKHQRIIGQQERLVGNMRDNYSGEIGVDLLDRMERAQIRAQRAADRMDAKAYKRLARKQNLVCETKEWIDPNGPIEGDQDGICEANEPCEEVVGDQIGDDIQPCTSHGRNKEVCVQVCGDGSAPSSLSPPGTEVLIGAEEETDPELMAEIEQSFDDTAGTLDDLNGFLEDNAGSFALMMENLRAAGGASTVCTYSADWQSIVIPILSGCKAANALARGVADVAERFCDQTAFGANTAAICATVEGIVSVINIAVVAFEGVVSGLQANLQTSTGSCLEDVSLHLNDVAATVVDPNGTLALVDANVRAIRANVVDPNGDLAVIKQASLQSSGNSVLMVDAINDHHAALVVHEAALATHDAAAREALLALDESLALLHQEQDLAFRLGIEELLSNPDRCIPSLWLPAAQGGKLETVRDHVASLIQGAISSGDPTVGAATAANHLAAADALIGSGQYRKACQRLTRAVLSLQ